MDKTFNLFVYGTLMRGFRSNMYYIPKDSEMLEGKITGNLYHYRAGFPMVEIFNNQKSITGSYDYLQDIEKQEDLNRVEPECLPFNLDYGKVYGELYKIPYDEDVLSALDSYEGFSPDNSSHYTRTLVPVQTSKGLIWAWVYNVLEMPSACVRIYSGDWRDCFYSNRGGLRPEIAKFKF